MLDFIRKTIVIAGNELMKYYDAPSISYKTGLDGRKSTVSQADHCSEKIISEAIHHQFPDHGILGEEGTSHTLDSEFVWHIDPLDGSTNFARKIPLFGLSIGLTQNGFPILGVMYFPKLDLIVYGEKGNGAYKNNDEEIHVSSRNLDESLYYISTAETRDGWHFPALKDEVGWVRAIDASSYELAQIAMGEADLYTFKNAYSYDIVAGAIIVQEARGKVSDEKGQEWLVNSKTVVISNGQEHQKVIKIIQEDLKT